MNYKILNTAFTLQIQSYLYYTNQIQSFTKKIQPPQVYFHFFYDSVKNIEKKL